MFRRAPATENQLATIVAIAKLLTMKLPRPVFASLLVFSAALAPAVVSHAVDAADEPALDFAKVDRKPVATFQARPKYPAELKEKKQAGEALIDFVVDAQGMVRNVRVVRATHPAFGEAAVESVQKWKFKPGEKDGRSVATRMRVPIVFTLNEKSK